MRVYMRSCICNQFAIFALLTVGHSHFFIYSSYRRLFKYLNSLFVFLFLILFVLLVLILKCMKWHLLWIIGTLLQIDVIHEKFNKFVYSLSFFFFFKINEKFLKLCFCVFFFEKIYPIFTDEIVRFGSTITVIIILIKVMSIKPCFSK